MGLKLKASGKLILSAAGKLTCACCCPTVLPSFVYDSVERSYSKCGYPLLTGDPSTGPKPRYFERREYGHEYDTQHFQETFSDGSVENHDKVVTLDYSRKYTYRRVDGSRGCGTIRQIEDALDYSWREDKTYTGPAGDSSCFYQAEKSPSSTSSTVYTGDLYCWYGFYGLFDDCGFTTTESHGATLDSVQVDRSCNKDGEGGWDLRNRSYDRLQVIELADEYDDALLESEVDADIAAEAFDDDYNDGTGSYLLWSADRLSLWKRVSKGALDLTGVDNLVDGREYDLVYIERFIPEDGSPSTDSGELTKTFTWSTGTTRVPVGPLSTPAANGTYVFIPVRWECA